MEGSSSEITQEEVKLGIPELDLSELPLQDSQNVSPDEENSVFTFTLEKFQNQRGKYLEATNMYNLLNDVANTDGNSSTDPNDVANDADVTVTTPLCNKSLEEVWDEIRRNDSSKKNENVNVNGTDEGFQQGEQTTGEMTLEEFLVKVGINIKDGTGHISSPRAKESTYPNSYGVFPNDYGPVLDPINGQGSMMMGLEHSQSNGENNMMIHGASVYPMYTTSGNSFGEGSNSIKIEKLDGVRTSGNYRNGEYWRAPGERVEQVLERRQRRMIKNRESAARSRARKYAYTCELEEALTAQKKENAKLKLMLVESENKRKKEALLKDQTSMEARQREEKAKTIRKTLSVGW